MAVGTLRNTLESAPSLRRPSVRPHVLAVTALVALVTSVISVQALNVQRSAAAGYADSRRQLEAVVAGARAVGYTNADLGPLPAWLAANHAPMPFELRSSTYYQAQQKTVEALYRRLPDLEARALARHKALALPSLSQAAAAIANAETQGAEPAQLDPLRARLTTLTAAMGLAPTPAEVARQMTGVGGLVDDAATLAAAAQAAQAQLRQAAEALKAQYAGNLEQVRGAGTAALGPGRNDATVAALLKIRAADPFTSRLERYAAMLGGSDLNQVALGAAGVLSAQQQVHNLLLSSMPSKAIVVSLSGQHLWAYQAGRVVGDTLVTTGRPALPTDVGAMKVLKKDSPWKMHSPWPTGSPWWYPDTVIQKVVWFTVTGEGIHDASWEPASAYGPGGQLTSSASHGCIHAPAAANDFIYGWADVGTPVIVFPGDGSPVDAQLRQVTVDDNGVPTSGPKGA